MVRKLGAQLFPERIKKILRPLILRKVHDNATPDPNSGIDIKIIDNYSIVFRPNTADELVLTHSFQDDIFFPLIPDFNPSSHSMIIDVGSHIGTFALLAARKFPSSNIFAIEACRDTFNILRLNIALNNMHNIIPFHQALADREGMSTLFYDRQNWGHSIVSNNQSKGEQIATDSLVIFFDKQGISECDLLRMNCEGAEFIILLSTPQEALRKIKTMLILYHNHLVTNANHQTLVDYIEKAGFHVDIQSRDTMNGYLIAQRLG